MKLTTHNIVYNAIIASIYVVISMITFPISFLGIQFRIAEVLILLVFFRRDLIYGLLLGCLITNLFSPIGLWDALFGVLASLIVLLSISFLKHLAFSVIIGTVVNGFVVGLELYLLLKEPFWISVGLVSIGEFTVLLVGYIFILLMKKNKPMMNLISPTRNIDFKW